MGRAQFADEESESPYVCLLDTGVNRGHRLLAPALALGDLHSVKRAWGVADIDGHGTEMAGLALWGNLTDVLAGSHPVEIGHRLESVKLIPTSGAGGSDSHHHGYWTEQAIVRPEITAPFRKRVFGMAVTSKDNRDRGQPTAWSAAVDSLATSSSDHGDRRRLIVVSAGNTAQQLWTHYPISNDSDGVHDPAQAWNSLTVGAFTELDTITGDDSSGAVPVAPAGGLSPFSTTSLTWQPEWPLKPDVVFEGGNAAKDSLGAWTADCLSLLTTNYRPANRVFTTTCATSAATALASRFAAQLMEQYPELWPEAVRALTVHSAEWTETMKRAYLPGLPERPKKRQLELLLRRCGFGVPDLDRALWSVSNSLTMGSTTEFVSVQEGARQAACLPGNANSQATLAARRAGQSWRHRSRDARHAFLLCRA